MVCTGIGGIAALTPTFAASNPQTAQKSALSDMGIRQDSISISDEARDFAAKQTSGTMDASMEDLKAQMKQSDEEGNAYQTYIKCVRIALRIINGDEVPSEDKQFLMDNEPDLYAKAITLRMQNENPKEYDSLLTDEDLEDPQTQDPLAATGAQSPDSDDATDSAAPVGEPKGDI